MKVPKHLAIIMDGNGRWAKERGLPRIAGHYEGVRRAEEVVEACIDLNIKWLTLFAFSTENWKRPEGEVKALMRLLEGYIRQNAKRLTEKGLRVSFVGRRDRLPESLVREMEKVERLRPKQEKLHVILAVDYGGRDEIIRTIRKMIETGSQIDESSFKLLSDFSQIPDPDLLIRTGGERRISNFLLWHLAYTELYFTDTYWPDFRREDLLKAIEDFSRRERKFGAVL
ncbi:MAG: polyprenyl diphosphate synthase [Aquificaceae bacterium]|nr:polyprenyl diphosphate synthase [Aquificaceae bacterium]MDW8422732.1 polyprenyl diphosphate synthase [Aquificaceae bacterium]